MCVTVKVGTGRTSGCRVKSFAAAAAPAYAAAYGMGRGRLRPLLASTSLAALLVGVGTPAAFAAACTKDFFNQTNVPSISNSTNINCINVESTTVIGNVTNLSGGVINATGSVTPTSNGITIWNDSAVNGAVVNAGQITATESGILITDHATVSDGISNAGTISAVGPGIQIMQGSTLTGGISNSGTISGDPGIIVEGRASSNVSVFDSGVIVGTGGVAVDLSENGPNTFTLGPGYSITGEVLGHGADTFQLGGTGHGAFDLSTIGPGLQYEGFATFNVVSGVWTLNNTFGQPETWNIDNGGVAVLQGTLPAVDVNSGGILGGTGTVVGAVTNAGTIQPGFGLPQTEFASLTVGNYVGAGGTLALRTVLGGDNSPTDKLIVNGNVTGTSSIFITNAGGQGAPTMNGIEVVEVGGTSPADAFTLANPELRAGAFDYRLFQGAPDPTASSWFLRSTFTNGPGPEEPIGPTPAPEPLPPGVFPIIGPELATYGVVQPIAREMGLTTLGTFHERVGDAAADAACLNADATGNSDSLDSAAITKAPSVPYSNCRPAVWGRLFGQQINDHYEAFADPRASGQIAGIQAGADLWRGSLIPGQSDTAGVYFAYGNGNVSVDGLVTNAAATAYVLEHTGGVNLNAYSVGGYWTHYGPGGWYIDAVLQGSFYSGNAATQFANLPLSGTGFTSSLETGYPIPLPWLGPRFVLEPEGQIIWQQVSFRDDNDGLGPVGLGTTSGASGRLGLRGKWTINDAAGRVWQPYVLANVWRDWGANATTMFGTDPVPLLEKATRLEFAGGLSAKILPGLSLYAQAGYQFAVSGTDGGTRDGVRGDLGAHYTW